MKPKIKIIKCATGAQKQNLYRVRFHIGVQAFEIDMGMPRPRKEALWYKKMLTQALSRLNDGDAVRKFRVLCTNALESEVQRLHESRGEFVRAHVHGLRRAINIISNIKPEK